MSKRFHTGRGPTQRQLRVAEMIRRALAELFAEGVPIEPELSDISITVSEVQLSADLKSASVYVLPLGGDQGHEIVEALNRARVEIRRDLNRAVYLKFSPRLAFFLDTAFDRMDEMKRLLELDDVKSDLERLASRQEAGIG